MTNQPSNYAGQQQYHRLAVFNNIAQHCDGEQSSIYDSVFICCLLSADYQPIRNFHFRVNFIFLRRLFFFSVSSYESRGRERDFRNGELKLKKLNEMKWNGMKHGNALDCINAHKHRHTHSTRLCRNLFRNRNLISHGLLDKTCMSSYFMCAFCTWCIQKLRLHIAVRMLHVHTVPHICSCSCTLYVRVFGVKFCDFIIDHQT